MFVEREKCMRQGASIPRGLSAEDSRIFLVRHKHVIVIAVGLVAVSIPSVVHQNVRVF